VENHRTGSILRVQIFAEQIFAFFGTFRESKFREIYKLFLDREN